MIKVRNLSKHYGTLKAVDDISFEVQTGEILGLLGPNAAGKTTTMRILTCYLPPTAGNIEVDDMNIIDDSMAIRKSIGYLPEDAPLYDDMNPLEYLKFIAEIRDIKGHKFKERMKGVIETCGLKGVLKQEIGQLSKGYRQRVGIAQCMLHDPEILVMDEPTTGLDPNQIVEIRNLIKELGKRKTVVLSTHILSEVQATCQRAVIINKGKIVADGSLEELQSGFQGVEKVYLELKAPKDEVLSMVSGLNDIKSIKEAELAPGDELWAYNVESTRGSDPREELFKLAVEKKWTMLEMRKEQANLEEIFRELTKD
ncbi:ATP-binding cassette domain-containing protein [bacterium]|nr:ATP-binding cassette domain-containing protein [bacterium]